MYKEGIYKYYLYIKRESEFSYIIQYAFFFFLLSVTSVKIVTWTVLNFVSNFQSNLTLSPRCIIQINIIEFLFITKILYSNFVDEFHGNSVFRPVNWLVT